MKGLVKKLCFEVKMWFMDLHWYFFRESCFDTYPPSFYMRHTPEEQKEIIAADMKQIQEILAETEK